MRTFASVLLTYTLLLLLITTILPSTHALPLPLPLPLPMPLPGNVHTSHSSLSHPIVPDNNNNNNNDNDIQSDTESGLASNSGSGSHHHPQFSGTRGKTTFPIHHDDDNDMIDIATHHDDTLKSSDISGMHYEPIDIGHSEKGIVFTILGGTANLCNGGAVYELSESHVYQFIMEILRILQLRAASQQPSSSTSSSSQPSTSSRYQASSRTHLPHSLSLSPPSNSFIQSALATRPKHFDHSLSEDDHESASSKIRIVVPKIYERFVPELHPLRYYYPPTCNPSISSSSPENGMRRLRSYPIYESLEEMELEPIVPETIEEGNEEEEEEEEIINDNTLHSHALASEPTTETSSQGQGISIERELQGLKRLNIEEVEDEVVEESESPKSCRSNRSKRRCMEGRLGN